VIRLPNGTVAVRCTRTLVLGAAVAAACTAAPAQAQTPEPPRNDNYLRSLSLNAPGKQLEPRDTLADRRDTAGGTVQADVFNPPESGGPREPTTCQGVSYGRTVWYDFYPHVRGFARIRVSGYDAVITVVPFNRRTAMPRFGRAQCINRVGATGTEEFAAEVGKGRAYTIQIGAVGDVAGMLDFRFDFLPDRDGDQVLDETDSCPTLAGTRRNGCPVVLNAEALLRARPISGGIEVVGLRVNASKRARFELTCSRGCRREVRGGRKQVGFRRIRGRRLRAGSSIVIRITRPNAIGAYIRYRILDGNFKRIERCMNPGSKRPRVRCR
jgi:hypothetical protein